MPDHNYVKTRKGIVDVVSLKQHTDLTKLYGTEKIRCLWHDDTTTPNLQIYPDHVYCFACGAVRDAISFVMTVEGITFHEALVYLQEHQSDEAVERKVITDPFSMNEILIAQNNLMCAKGVNSLNYLHTRGLNLQIIRDLKLGTDYGSIWIPHFANGSCVNIKFRNLTNYGPKYNSLPHREFKFLYPYDYFRMKHAYGGALYLCEGEFDAMLLLQAGLPAMSIPAGANTPLEQYALFFKNFKVVYLLFDQDDAGQKAVDRVLFHKLAYGMSLSDTLVQTTSFIRITWEPSWGKDVTEARSNLIPKILERG
jgi:DNA primase